MTYQQLSGNEINHREAIQAGIHDAISDVTKYAMIALIAVIAYNAMPKKLIQSVKREIRRVTQ